MTRETDTSTDPCPRCFGRGAIFVADAKPHVCPDCRGTGSAVVKQYAEWAVAEEREACAKIAEAMSHCHETPGIGKICGCVWCACAERLAITIRARGAEGKESKQNG